jgi:hypothetical protein
MDESEIEQADETPADSQSKNTDAQKVIESLSLPPGVPCLWIIQCSRSGKLGM